MLQWWRLIAVALLAASGCGDNSTPIEPLALQDFGAAARDAVCDWAVRCRHVPDRLTCERLLDPKDYDTRRAADAVEAGRLLYDPAAGGQCVAATRAQACLASALTHESCLRMFSGLIEPGGACTSRFECVGRAACEELSCEVQCCLGACGEPPPTTPQEPRKQVGERCTSHFECEDDAYCESDGRCTAVPAEAGQRCLFGCGYGDLYCDLDELVCKRYGAAGQSCDPSGVSAPPCDEAWSYCEGVCRPLPGPGQACSEDIRCIPTAYCVGGRCRERGSPGDPCSTGEQCDVACDREAGECVPYATCSTAP